MPQYSQETLESTNALIQAVIAGDVEKAQEAILKGADVNCRIVPKDTGGFEIASEEQLSRTLTGEEIPQTGDMPVYNKKVHYEVPMVGTTTLLNYLASYSSSPALNTAKLLMDNDAELGGIDYLSYWESWGNKAQNYFQNTPLLNAIASENEPFASLYMTYVQKLDIIQRKELLNYKDKFIAGFHTALEFAIRRGYSSLATSIVKAGADTNPQPFVYSYGGKSPLHMACMLLGNSNFQGTWHKKLGSDLELITTLIEHGADYTKKVRTEVYTGTEWQKLYLTPFDYLEIEALLSSLQRSFSFIEAFNNPAFAPSKRGHVKHPFHEDECFLDSDASGGRDLEKNRKKYLGSDQFQQKDKIVLQRSLLKQIIQEYNEAFPPGTVLLEVIESIEVSEMVMLFMDVDKINEHQNWRSDRLFLSGLVMRPNLEKNATETPINEEENPLFNPNKRNRITHCSINHYQGAEILQGDKPLEQSVDKPVEKPVEAPGEPPAEQPNHTYHYGEFKSRFHALRIEAPRAGVNIRIGDKEFSIVPANSNLSGDKLKRTILDNIARCMSQIDTREKLDDFKRDFKQSDAYTKILVCSQGITTAILSFFGKKTDSVKAFEAMCANKEKSLDKGASTSSPVGWR